MMHHNKGFTLVELAIVIVIIGLLVGGVLQGQSLIRASERNSVMADIKSFQAAFLLFKDKFNVLPGDTVRASSFWPNCNATPAYCNGDGDQRINDDAPFEDLKVWRHLSLAGLIKGSYTGVGTDNIPSNLREINTNVPASKVKSAGYMVDFIAGPFYGFSAFHIMWVGTMISNGTTNKTIGGLLLPEEALSFEQKFDDGVATTGDILIKNGYTAGITQIDKSSTTACVNGNTASDTTATFNIAVQSQTCTIVYRPSF